jgi:hypothetical protein
VANPLTDGSLAQAIYKAFTNSMAYDITLHSVTEAEDAVGSITKSETDVLGRGIVTSYEDKFYMEGLVPDGNRKAILFQPSFSTAPKLHDRLTPLSGTFSGQVFMVAKVKEDPAGATWVCELRPVRD